MIKFAGIGATTPIRPECIFSRKRQLAILDEENKETPKRKLFD